MLEIVRPAKVEVKIFGKVHVLKRLSKGDVIDLMAVLKDVLPILGGLVEKNPAAVQELIVQADGIMDLILRRSFPSFEEWEELDASEALKLFEAAWAESNILGIFEDFSRLIGKMKAGLPNQGRSRTR
jgi:hypothetical protein